MQLAIQSQCRWWKFDLLDKNGGIAGGGMVAAPGPASALAHALTLAGCCTVQLRVAGELEESASVPLQVARAVGV